MGKFGHNFWIRLLSGAGLVVVFLAAVLLSKYTFVLLMAVIGVGSMWELFRMAGQGGAQPQKYYPMVLGALLIVCAFLTAGGYIAASYMLLFIPAAMVMFAAELFRKREQPIVNVSVSLATLIYAALPMALMSFIAFAGGQYAPFVVLAYIFTVWVNDIFAYLTGVAFGKHKMFERISPKKSWEGFFGGLIFAIAFAVLCGHLLGRDMVVWGGLGLVIVVSAVLGDFVESMFKRSVGVKDSGSIIPGHGGFLDRFDALLFSVPFVFCYFIIFAP